MVDWQFISKRKETGAKRKIPRGKRKREMGRFPVETRVGERAVKRQRVRGGNIKTKTFKEQFVNVNDGSTTKRVKIIEVLQNPSNKDYDRRKIITRNTLLKTELGTVRVTSRPGQHGLINGKLAE